ncbi:G protein-activated inward rectifier potassium channel 3-like [Hydractinia symbiolongicarpus]|uniref:G protein-activated inward rectifier potassium channel 3-like n=1 Tax=Hydractinia symbiolongicarpus TaxID=13093 RepID=UPI00254BD279|nr:G protein-activated inward rectifier potassium channel 3-like [Hydractinia symbiolongicarpus]
MYSLTKNVNSEKMTLSGNKNTYGSHGTLDSSNVFTQENYTKKVSDVASERDVLESYDNIVDGVRFRRQRSRSFRKPSRRRLVEKNGKRNVRSKVFPRDRYLQDIFTTIIDAKWKWMIVLFVVFYLGSWLLFGFFWWIVMITHGTKCFDNVTNFTEAFLLSLETSMTIGYGGRQVTSKCPETVILLIIQSLASCIIEACIIGLIFTKVARPGKRQSTIVFSKNAVITKRDDKFCLMFNIADVRKKQLGECHVRLHLFRTYKTLEGTIIQNQQNQLRVGMDWYNIRDDSDRLFLLFPCAVTHVIDRKSPFYNVSKEMYENSDWELVVILEGVVEATGCVLQARTSYLPNEVYWGRDLVNLATYDDWHEDQGILYMLRKLNETVPAPYVPICSPLSYYKSISKYPDPDEVYTTQDELWDDQNFTEPGDEPRVLPTHVKLTESENNVII